MKPPPGLKRCPDCKETKPAEEFGRQASRLDGRNSYCRLCLASRERGRRASFKQQDVQSRIPIEKRCPQCTLTKPSSDFFVAPYARTGLAGACKQCVYQSTLRRRAKRISGEMIVVTPLEKRCPDCKEIKPAAAFTSDRGSNTQLGAYCSPCHTNRYRVYAYGLSPEGYEQMVREHDERCGICRKKIKLVIDHDHETGRVRGLLCHQCNRALGHFGDSVEGLQRALTYLECHDLSHAESRTSLPHTHRSK